MFKIIKDGQLPTKGSKYAACVDLYAREEVIVDKHKTVLIPLGVAIDEEKIKQSIRDNINEDNSINILLEEFKSSHYLQLMLRSSLSKKLIIANGVGVIDIDYQDEIMIRVHNPFQQYIIKKGDKIAQITLLKHNLNMFHIHTNTLRTGGFGSTDNY